MTLSLAQQVAALEAAALALIQDTADAGGDGDVLYQAQINAQQACMWLRKALGAELAPAPPAEPAFDDSPPREDAHHVLPRRHNGEFYWWRWRDRQWVLFNELPEDSQVRANETGATLA